jgi:LysR family hca operon transcriptional activator
MELRHLRYFIGVAEAGSFTLAAERLHTVQPSLSRQVRDLEAYIGTPLFERSTRRVRLTAAGQVMLDEARLVLAHADRAVERVRQTARAQNGRLVLGFVFGVEAEQLVRVTNSLHDELAQVELVMRSQTSPALIAELHEQRLDAAFIRPSEQARGLLSHTLRHERLIAALPAGHRLAGAPSIGIAQLAEEPLINVPREHAPVLHQAVRDYAARYAVELRWSYESENLMMALSLISSVDGVCLLPEYSVRLFPQGVVAVPLADETPTIELALAWHPDNRSPVLAAFLAGFLKGS